MNSVASPADPAAGPAAVTTANLAASAAEPATPQDWTWRGHSIRFSALACGQPAGVPLVLVHGFGASIGHWKHNMPAWAAAGYSVFALDLLGFGASDKPVQAYSLALWQDLLVDFCQEIVQRPAIFVGNSIGALLSLMMAANHPELTRGTVLLNCAGGLSHRSDELPPLLRPIMGTFNALVNSEQLGGLMFNLVRRKPQIRRALSQVYRRRASVTEELVEMLYQPSCHPNAQKVFAAILTADPGPSIDELLPRITQPMLVLWGEADPWTPVQGAQAFRERAKLPGNEFISIPDTGHCPHDERPELVNPLVLNWLHHLAL